MSQPLVSSELSAFAEDLIRSSIVEVYYLDEGGNPYKATSSTYQPENGIQIELRPQVHIVVIETITGVIPRTWCAKTITIPLERVLIVKVFESGRNEDEPSDVPLSYWVVAPRGNLLRLTP